ncbi:hypothetical protein ACINK0_15860 [Deinococcus sp. VB343]|uniref:hypothetical protein n=1 Tax=Deinococcus sp. VB343 TaxID=3385567 RepID=UPI0039C935B7
MDELVTQALRELPGGDKLRQLLLANNLNTLSDLSTLMGVSDRELLEQIRNRDVLRQDWPPLSRGAGSAYDTTRNDPNHLGQ